MVESMTSPEESMDEIDGGPVGQPGPGDVVRIEREFGADADRLWDAIADPDQLSEWWGGDVDIPMESGTDGEASTGRGPAYIDVEEVDPPHRLVFRWATEVDAPTRVELDVEPTESGSRLTVTEMPVPPGVAVANLDVRALATI